MELQSTVFHGIIKLATEKHRMMRVDVEGLERENAIMVSYVTADLWGFVMWANLLADNTDCS